MTEFIIGFKFSKSIIVAVSMGLCLMYMVKYLNKSICFKTLFIKTCTLFCFPKFSLGTLEGFYLYLEYRRRYLTRADIIEEVSQQIPAQILASHMEIEPIKIAPIILAEERFWFDVIQGVIIDADGRTRSF